MEVGDYMADLLFFNDSDELTAIASNETEDSLHYWDAHFSEKINQANNFEFSCLPDHTDSPFIEEGHQVAFLDKDGFFRLFKMSNVDLELNDQGEYIKVRCEDAVLDLTKNILRDLRPQNVTLQTALQQALSGQNRWQVGQVGSFGNRSTNFYYTSSIEAIGKCLEIWDAELRVRVEVQNNKITGRFIDAIKRGNDTGLLLEVGHNINGLTLTVETGHIRSLLYGRGSGVALYDEESGEATGGYSRRIMFDDLIATNSTHGFSKPRGQAYLVDEEARVLYGLVDPATGQRTHLEGVFESSSQEDPDLLMRETWEALKQNNHPWYFASCNIALLSELLGSEFDHEQLRLGDTIRLADNDSFNSPLRIESRVIGFTYDLADSESADVEMGNFKNLYAEDDRLNKIEDGLNNGNWSRPPVVGPGNIANVRPGPITNFEAFSGFSQIHLFWDMQSLIVRDYEIHGSEVQGFVPSPSNLIARTNVNAFSHTVEANRRWYYRVRAMNHHEVAGSWSPEVYGQTANTRELDELEEQLDDLNNNRLPALEEKQNENDQKLEDLYENTLPDLSERLTDLEVESEILKNVTLPKLDADLKDNEQKINDLNNVTLPILDERLKSAEQNFLDAQKRIDDAMADIRDVEDLLHNWQWQDTVEIDGGKIRADTILARSIQAGSITTVQIQAGSIVGDDLAINTITAREINAQTITALEIASDAIITRHISTNAITSNEIAANTIVADNISTNAIIARHISANAVTANEIAAQTITAAEIATGAITAEKIAANSVIAGKINANAITAREIAANAITASEIAANTITANQIAIETITANRIATNAIIARHITAGSIVADKLASGSVTTVKLAAGAVTANTIAANAVTAEKILARTITADKLTTNAIQVGFNAMGNTLNLTATALTFNRTASVRFMSLTGTQLQFYNTSNTLIGGFSQASYNDNGTTRQAVAYFAHAGSVLLLGRGTASAGTALFVINGSNNTIRVGGSFDIYNAVIMNNHQLRRASLNNCFASSNLNMGGFSITNQSDIRLKENVEDTVVSGIEETKKLRMVDFDWKQNNHSKNSNFQGPSGRQFGMIAQEAPFLLAKKDDIDQYLKIDLNKQVNLNTKTNQELILIVEKQERRIRKLENEMEKSA